MIYYTNTNQVRCGSCNREAEITIASIIKNMEEASKQIKFCLFCGIKFDRLTK